MAEELRGSSPTTTRNVTEEEHTTGEEASVEARQKHTDVVGGPDDALRFEPLLGVRA